MAVYVACRARRSPIFPEEHSEMEGKDLAAAVMTVALVFAGVILATVIMNRFGDVLSLSRTPERRAGGA